MPYYAVTRTQTWERTRGLEEQPLWDEHAAFMDNLVEEGTIVVAGPLDGGPKVLLIFAAESEDEWVTPIEVDDVLACGHFLRLLRHAVLREVFR